jgi:hypothetical protein
MLGDEIEKTVKKWSKITQIKVKRIRTKSHIKINRNQMLMDKIENKIQLR